MKHVKTYNMKNKFKITRADYLKAMRKARREEEIREHLHPVNINRVHTSRKVYNRKRSKADLNKDLPYFYTNTIWSHYKRIISALEYLLRNEYDAER